MFVRTTEEVSPDSIPTRPRLGFRISRGKTPMEMPWIVETWGKKPHVYMRVESQKLIDAIKMMVIARTYKPEA